MTRTRIVKMVALLAALVPAVAGAQGEGGRQRPLRDDLPPAVERRARMEQALRETFARTVRERLALTDEQATKLQEVNARFAEERVRILRDEFRVRRDLRQALARGDSTRSPETAKLLDQLLDVQRQRLEVQQREQQALAEFLTPDQRARYLALMEELRRRVQQRVERARDARAPLRPPPF